MDIKQRLRQVLDGIRKDGGTMHDIDVLCHDALAAIEGLETAYASLSNAIDERNPHLRTAGALERIADILDKFGARMYPEPRDISELMRTIGQPELKR